MVELEVWYTPAPAGTPRDERSGLRVHTTDEMDALIVRVQTETRDHRCPAMVQVNIVGRKRHPVLEVGLGQTAGFIHYHAPDSGRTVGDGDPARYAEYVYMGNLSEIPADSEVPIETVRAGLHEFLATGRRPSVIQDHD